MSAHEQRLASIASESLSRVDCPFCGGRLYTGHREECPVPAAQKKRNAELVALMTKARKVRAS